MNNTNTELIKIIILIKEGESALEKYGFENNLSNNVNLRSTTEKIKNSLINDYEKDENSELNDDLVAAILINDPLEIIYSYLRCFSESHANSILQKLAHAAKAYKKAKLILKNINTFPKVINRELINFITHQIENKLIKMKLD